MNATRVAGFVEVAIAAALWAALVTGSAVIALTVPAYTSTMSQALGIPQTAGLPTADVVRLSGQVRALVADREYDPLPAVWKGAPAFDSAAVSHLLDVRRVIGAARVATGVAALLLAAYVAFCVGKRRLSTLGAGMRAGAALCGALIVLGVIAASVDFESFFAAFHGLFFAAGTWTFPSDSLLIRLFPERFWVASGACWAALLALGAVVLLVMPVVLRGAEARLNASRTANNV